MSRVTVDGEVVREFVTVGVQGPPGVDSMPPGGGAGEALVKQSGANFDADWSEVVDATARGDASQALADASVADGKAVAAQGDIDAHVPLTTGVHGIADTSDLILEGDARLADARVPTSHASTHAVGGSDEVSPAAIGAASVAEVQAAQSTADAAIPSSEKGAADGVATLDAGGVVPTPQLLTAMAMEVPASWIVAWDDFRTDSADVNGRVAPSGQTWATLDEDGGVITGRHSVEDGYLETTGTPESAAVIPISASDTNGIRLECMFGARGITQTIVGLVVFGNAGDSVRWQFGAISATRGLFKRIDGVTTQVESTGFTPFFFGNGHSTLLRAGLSLSAQQNWSLGDGFGPHGGDVAGDSEMRAVLENATHIGILARRTVVVASFRLLRVP